MAGLARGREAVDCRHPGPAMGQNPSAYQELARRHAAKLMPF